MGEAAVKEPSMEDILSSIRKIIAEEGGTEPPVASGEVETPAVAETYVPEPEVQAHAPLEPEQEYGAAGSVEVPHVEPEISVEAYAPVEPEVVQEPVYQPAPAPEPAPVQADGSMSLASIAASLRSAPEAQPEVPTAQVTQEIAAPVQQEPSMQTETYEAAPAEETYVEMAEATPPPAPQGFAEQAVGVPAPTASDMAREEEAFRGALMSPSADGAVSDSFERLKRSAMDDLDAKTEAILRPMLREWLDENLPSMVERLVREEIERVARG